MSELEQGHVPCECGEFTHILSMQALLRLPPDYSGELCPRCSMWMCRIDMLAPIKPTTNEPQWTPTTS